MGNMQYKPCPLCGKDPVVSYTLNCGTFKVSIHCAECDIHLSREVAHRTFCYDENPGLLFVRTEEQIKKTWNTRAGEKNESGTATEAL